jgi:tetratricopeptide (TPR) repeat protein
MATAGTKVIRVFLSSTFVDFQEERSLLVKHVFPSLRRRAKSRGVDIVDVDLRWGVTAEQTERGETLPLCLAEIDNCRPYFISLLGERYGWVPPPDFYQPALLERQPWLKERMGGASVTELEILHGVLRNPEMAGHALFYLRDPAYAHSQQEEGWVAENPAEQQRLQALKEQIRASGFPVVEEGLATPQAIAKRIEADLWAVIEREHPEQEPPDALQREGQRHSDYRRSRTGLYLGGEAAIEQLEGWIAEGEQRILITGESGAGKSALIANWLETHQRSAPQDLVHAHHLGCTNDASAVRPLLGRLIDTASQLLLAEDPTAEPLKVPQDWWELVFMVGDVFAKLSCSCQKQGCRWILVLDGLDRLAEDDQQALPWIPTTLPPGIHVVASALECPARQILQERQYRTHEIGPLGESEQQQLIERYLSRYTKQLESGLQQKILKHPLSGSPLFLRVLLEELRQCAWYDTLAEHLDFYLSAQTIDGLYEKVLERLEGDGHGEATRKSLTALWASRAGLSETELLDFTGLATLDWAPVDLALSEAFGRNGERLEFDHDYLGIAVQGRYLPSEDDRRQAHILLGEWFADRDVWDTRDSEELPLQLMQAGQLEELCDWLLVPGILAQLQWDRGSRETISYWTAARAVSGGELDELIAKDVEKEIEARKDDASDLIWFIDRIADVLDQAGLYRELLLRLRMLSVELEETRGGENEKAILRSLAWLASVHQSMCNYRKAEALYCRGLEASEQLLGPEHPDTLGTVDNLGVLFRAMGEYGKAEAFFNRALKAEERLLGPEHPDTLSTVDNLGVLFRAMGEYGKAEIFFNRALEAEERLLGHEHPKTLITVGNLGALYKSIGDYGKAEAFYKRALEASERLLGPEHPETLNIVGNLGELYGMMGEYRKAETFHNRVLEARERLLGPEHPDTLITIANLGGQYQSMGDYGKAEAFYIRALEDLERALRPDHPVTLIIVSNLGGLYGTIGEYGKAEAFYNRALEAEERLLGPEHPSTLITVGNLGGLYVWLGEYGKAEAFYNRALEAEERLLGAEHPNTLGTVDNLGVLFMEMGEYGKAEAFFNRALEAEERLLGTEHPKSLTTVANLGALYQSMGEYGKAEAFYNRALEANERRLGPEHPVTLSILAGLGLLHQLIGNYSKAEAFHRCALEARERLFGPEHPETLSSLGNLGGLYLLLGDYGKAETFYNRVLEDCDRLLGPDRRDTFATVANLGAVYQMMGEYDKAESFQSRALEVCERLLGPEHPDTLTSVANLGLLYESMHNYGKSEAFHSRALDARERLLGPEHPATLTSVYSLAAVLSQQKRRLEAIPLRRRELAWCREVNGDNHCSTMTSINGLAIDLRETGALEEAESLFRELVAGYQQILEPSTIRFANALSDLAKTLEAAGKIDEAITYLQQELEHRLTHEGNAAAPMNAARLHLARLLICLERKSDAKLLLKEIIDVFDALGDPSNEHNALLEDAVGLLGSIMLQGE